MSEGWFEMDEVQQKELNKGVSHKLLHFNLTSESRSKKLLFIVHFENLLSYIPITTFLCLHHNAIKVF